jgi:hypothetical protein
MLIYDFLLFGGIILLFILILIAAVVLREKIALAVFLVFVAFGVLTAGSFAGYATLHHYLFKHQITLKEVKALQFTEALLVKGEITNLSKRTFTECTLHVGVYKVTHNPYIDPIYPYIPFQKSSIHLKQMINKGEKMSFKLFVEPFRYTKDYNITAKAACR